MSNKITERASFDLIRYANCWEDADILVQSLAPNPGSRILSIASAGDNSFSLLVSNPEIVAAVDISIIQLYLVELKKIAIKQLEYDAVLSFLGFNSTQNRIQIFEIELKPHLSDACATYWQIHLNQIEAGIINQGKFEKYFQLFSKKILPFVHSSKTVEKLLLPKTQIEQLEFYNQKWNTWRWKLFFKIFFSKYIMGKYGRDPEFLKQVNITVGEFIFQKADKHLKSYLATNNFMLRYCLTGSFGKSLPHYLIKENFEVIKKDIDKIVLFNGYAEDAIKKFGKFDFMNLSNIFEYMDEHLFLNTAQNLVEGMNAGGKIAYWNLMVPRKISKLIPNKVKYLDTFSTGMSANDKGFFYNEFILEECL